MQQGFEINFFSQDKFQWQQFTIITKISCNSTFYFFKDAFFKNIFVTRIMHKFFHAALLHVNVTYDKSHTPSVCNLLKKGSKFLLHVEIHRLLMRYLQQLQKKLCCEFYCHIIHVLGNNCTKRMSCSKISFFFLMIFMY